MSETRTKVETANKADGRQDQPLKQPLVSVIIPCYKQARFLGEAIESVLNQTYTNCEIIVVDDGSPDNASEVAAQYSGVRVIRQKNQGISAARNTGIRESRGDYLVFLDSDDRLRPNALEAGVKCMAGRPGLGLVFGRYHCIKEDGSLCVSPLNFYKGDLYLGLLNYNCIGMVAPVMYRSEVFDTVGGFDSKVDGAEDYDMYLRIARRYPSNRHDEIIAEYRVYESSASNNLGVMMRGVILSLWSQKKYIKGKKEYEAYQAGLKFWRKLYGEPLYLQTARGMWDIRNCLKTIRNLWYLFRYYPQFIVIHGRSRLNKALDKIVSWLEV